MPDLTLPAAVNAGDSRPAEDAEDHCHRCGGPNITWSAPSPLWNEVMRGGDINGDWQYEEIICPTCFAVLAERAGIAFCWRLSADDVRRELSTTTPSGRTWNAETWLWDEPEPSSPAAELAKSVQYGIDMLNEREKALADLAAARAEADSLRAQVARFEGGTWRTSRGHKHPGNENTIWWGDDCNVPYTSEYECDIWTGPARDV